MKQFGWSEGKGLGAKEDGMAEAIKVKQKKDQTGVGANSSGQWRDKWWEEAYAQSVSTINGAQVEIKKLNSDSSSSDDSDDSSDSGVDVSSVTKQLLHADGTKSSATAAEAKLATQLAKDPWGRFGGRQGKMARIRAQEEAQLAALAAKAAPAAIATGLKRKASPVPLESSKTKRRKDADSNGSESQLPKPQPVTIIVADPIAEQLAAAHNGFSRTPASGWWGAKRFISSGAMGAGGNGDKPTSTGDRQQFTEDTQENLYMALHNAKTSGKTGLGKGKGNGIIGGAKWVGSKVSFDDADQSTDQAAAKDSAPQAADAPVVSPAATVKRFPFVRVISSSLQEAEGHQLTTKALCNIVREH